MVIGKIHLLLGESPMIETVPRFLLVPAGPQVHFEGDQGIAGVRAVICGSVKCEKGLTSGEAMLKIEIEVLKLRGLLSGTADVDLHPRVIDGHRLRHWWVLASSNMMALNILTYSS